MSSKQEPQDPGSRDLARGLIKQVEAKMLELAGEINKLRAGNRKRVEYRYADAHIIAAMANLELVKIVLRKRVKKEDPTKKEVPAGDAKLVKEGE